MKSGKIVAVGFLTQADLSLLGSGFNRLFPVEDASMFDDLLSKLEHVKPVLPEPSDETAQR